MKEKKKIRYLLTLSTTKGMLDPKKIAIIAPALSKRELLYYYRLLRKIREAERVTVVTPIVLPSSVAAEFKEIFQEKDTVFSKDETLLAGLTVQFTDFLFDASMKTLFERIKKQYEIN